MKNTFLLFLLLSCLAACTKETNRKEINQRPVATPEFVDIVSESGLNDFVIFRNDRTWRDLDVFYQSSVEKYKERTEINNLKCAAILSMVNFFKMLDDNSAQATERIGYYAQEMAGLKNCNPEVLYPMLIRLQGHWEPAKISQTAKTGYDNAISLFNAMGKSAPTPEYEVRKRGMGDLASLIEVKK